MPTIDELSFVLANQVADSDLIYVGLPLNSDSDRRMLVSEAKDLFLPDAGVTNAKLRNSVGLSVVGRAGNTTGSVADIVAAADGYVLRRSGTSVGFGEITSAGIGNAQVTEAKLASNAVTESKIGSGAVTTAKIGDSQVTNAKVAAGLDAAKIANGSVSNTEFQYLDGVTSSIQTQLNAKAADSAVVKLTGNQTVGGAKTFTNGITVQSYLRLPVV